MIKKYLFFLFILIMLFAGCSSMKQVNYSGVDKTNWVQVTLNNGEKIQGTVLSAEPYQLVVRDNKGQETVINVNDVRDVQRKTPVCDDSGQGIPEEEIAKHQTGRNTVIYGIGGSMLSFGASFFAGSMMTQAMDDGGGALAATTLAGGGLGAMLFIHAGKAMDRKQAIELICEQRQNQPAEIKESSPSLDELNKRMTNEKKRQEELRKEREELLRRLEDKNKSDE